MTIIPLMCPITNQPCKTNGCGTKCYKRDTLNTEPKSKAFESDNDQSAADDYIDYLNSKY